MNFFYFTRKLILSVMVFCVLCVTSGGVYIMFLLQVAGMIITYELVLLQINEDSGDWEKVLCNTIIA